MILKFVNVCYLLHGDDDLAYLEYRVVLAVGRDVDGLPRTVSVPVGEGPYFQHPSPAKALQQSLVLQCIIHLLQLNSLFEIKKDVWEYFEEGR